MKYIIDHDYHIHSKLSLCSMDPEQTPERILKYAEDNGLKEICLTDHFWDADVHTPYQIHFYEKQNYEWVAQALPLPQSPSVKFHFGCETDMDRDMRIGISKSAIEKFEFIIVPTTHLHMPINIDEKDDSEEARARLYVERFRALLNADFCGKSVGIAHLNCSLIAPKSWDSHIRVLDSIPDETYEELFTKTAARGFGVELNFDASEYKGAEMDSILRIYRIAKKCGCKFYFGSDAHHPKTLDKAVENFHTIADLLELEEEDKFHPFG